MSAIGSSKERARTLTRAIKYAMEIPLDEMPPCFDREEDWRLWHAYNRTIASSGRASTPCDDCLPEFCQRMKNEGRCYPEIKLQRWKGGEIKIRANYKKWADDRIAVLRHGGKVADKILEDKGIRK